MFKINNQKFTLADCVVDPQTNLLIRNANQKRIEHKTMALLILLVEHQSTVVSRKEILETLWPSVVVGEEMISQLIYSLRNALGDDAKNPKYIETIPKKGYRFIAEVKLVSLVNDQAPNNKETQVDASTELNTSQGLGQYKLYALLSLLIFSTIIVVWLVTNNNGSYEVENILPITQSKGVESDFAINTNTNEMIYVHSVKGSTELYRREVDGNQSFQITHNEWKEYSPYWLSNKLVIYIRQNGNEYQIVQHSLPNDIQVLYESNTYIYNLTLTPHRPNEVFFIEFDDYRHDRLNELKSLNLDNGNVEFLHNKYLNLPKEVYHASFSEDGNSLYFVDHSEKSNVLTELQLDKNKVIHVNDHFNAIEHIAHFNSNTLLIAGTIAATKGIWQVELNGEPPTLLLPMSAGYKVTQTKLYNKNIYYNTYKAPINLAAVYTKDKTIDNLPNVNSEANELSAIYSHDGKLMYFASDRTGYYELWQYDFTSQLLTQITQIKASMIHRPIISSDNSKVAMVYEKETLTLGVFSIENGQVQSEMPIPSMKFPLAWSKDDKSLYVSEHKRQVNIYRYDANTLVSALIQKKAGLYARESEDGQFLTLVDYKHHGLIQKNLDTGEEVKLNNDIDNLDYLVPGQLTVKGNNITTLKYANNQQYLYQYPLEKNENTLSKNALITLPDSSAVTDIISVDETEKALFTFQTAPQGNIMAATLKKR